MVLQEALFHSFYGQVYCILCVCVCVTYLLYPSFVDGHLGCFHVLVIESNAAVSIGVQVSFPIRVSIFSGYMFRSGIICIIRSGLYGNSVFHHSFFSAGTSHMCVAWSASVKGLELQKAMICEER